MSYIGNQSENKVSPAYMRETLSPDGSATYFDLIHDVPGYQAENVLVTVNNVIQEPVNAYTIINDGNNRPRRLNFGVALASTDSLYVIHRGAGELYHTPPSNSVGSSALQDNLKSGNVDSFTATAGQTAFTLSEIPLNAESIHVYVNGIYQKPITNYTVTGSSTTLTLSSGILVGDEVDVHHNTIRSTVSHVPDAGVTTTKLDANAVTTVKIADGAISDAKLSAGTTAADSFNLPGQHVKIPSITTTQRDALTAAAGMMIYNSTLGIMQQYNAQGWASIDSPPTLSSFTYPSGLIALEPAGDSSATLVLTGTNFQVGVTVTIDDSAPTSVTRNSSTQITITGYPAKAAATYTNGLSVTNPTGLSASADIVYDAVPTWTTAAGSLGTFQDGSYTNSSATTIRIVAAEGSDTIDYAQTNSAGVVNTDGVAGLTLGTTGANAGYLTGTLSGTEGTTYNFYAKPTDDEGQVGAVRLFNIISGYPASGGTVTEYGSYIVHTFLLANTGQTFTPNSSLAVEYLVIGGGGGGGDQGSAGSGGGGAGGFRFGNSTFSAQDYTITVGAGGAGGSSTIDNGDPGGLSSIAGSGFTTFASAGGGYGGGQGDGGDGGSGGGAGHAGSYGEGNTPNTTPAQGVRGGNGGGGNSGEAGGGGGGASDAGGDGNSQNYGGTGGDGKYEVFGMNAANTTLLFASAGIGEIISSVRWVAGGGGGGIGGAWGPKGAGGNGGGGDGATAQGGSVAATNGLDNAGAGGGGNGGTDPGPAGDGGNGVVIFRYAA